MISIIIQHAPPSGARFPLELLSTLLGAASALAGIGLTGWLARRAEKKARAESIRTTRLAIYSQLRQTAKTAWGHIQHVLAPDKPTAIWVPLHEELLPGSNMMKSLELLTPAEVYAVTAFAHAYQENMGYILGNGTEAAGGLAQMGFSTIRYDFADREKRFWLIMALLVIEYRCRWARDELGKVIKKTYGEETDWSKLVDGDRESEEKTEKRNDLWVHYHPESNRAKAILKSREQPPQQ